MGAKKKRKKRNWRHTKVEPNLIDMIVQGVFKVVMVGGWAPQNGSVRIAAAPTPGGGHKKSNFFKWAHHMSFTEIYNSST
jgi:hypothetical protein